MTLTWIEVEDYTQLSEQAAAIFTKQLKKKSNSVFGLATGGTPIGFYEQFIKQTKEQQLSFQYVSTFNLDEYVGVDSQHESSYHFFMRQHLFQYIDLKKENIHIPNGLTIQNPAAYDTLIEAVGGIDIQLLGIGLNGHIGFNEPGTPFNYMTHVVELAQSTRQANSVYFQQQEDVPTHAITMGIQSILKAKKIVLLVSGKSKREALKRLRTGEISEDFPASVLHQHPDVTIIFTDK